MKLLTLLFSLILLSPSVLSKSTPQRLVVDKEHIQMGQQGQVYIIQPSDELIIDASRYDYTSFSSMLSDTPNTAKVIIDGTEFSFYWEKEKNEYLLNKDSLVSHKDIFKGFESGKEIMFALGKSEKGIGAFYVYWVGKALVK
ncbi:hypothetical protein [Vibrio mangrovi]|uniref:Uncharacterized protein n=1 Tax=Vibrio mangrovi TaxID=474394 RepID=A0A1Y6IWV4_9VIBR|nr:hypothetical protein [Vibrio mangrovi]MDW6005434.1 hypothetical protein [Vibrio mangrovi]SMS02126.1 hypothetical protein VIM7927_03444 [Vibrio mangrovi]